jgi:hypothetical protein
VCRQAWLQEYHYENFPDWCKQYAKRCLNRQWKLFALGVLFFGVTGTISFFMSYPYFGVFFLVFCLFEIYGLFTYGFKKLTPEQEKQINESDPTKLWPVKFWKK